MRKTYPFIYRTSNMQFKNMCGNKYSLLLLLLLAGFVFRRFPSPTMAGNVANRDRTDGAMEQRPAANLERGVPAAVGVL
jgi:hypothetical protein